ncbi:MAG: GNAT family N-acetyltransferase [Parachlamydiaceae bacterium]|nr:GNAT family N-acetyltransferase [Parachlamydiaceae bacterium]
MLTIAPLTISQLLTEEKERWHSLLEKKYWPCLDGKDPWGVNDSVIVAVGASDKEVPVAILVATFRKPTRHALILNLYVEPDFRHRKIGTQLLILLEAILVEQGCSLVTYVYQSDLPTTIYLEKILNQLGWGEGFPFSIRCHFNRIEFSPDWLNIDYHLPKGYQIFHWKNLRLKEKKQLERDLQKEWIPPSVSPFHQQETIDPNFSLGLRKDGRVIGWVIVNRFSEGMLQYSSLYIEREYKFLGYSIHLLAASIRLVKKSNVEGAFLELNLQESDNSWIRFVKRRLVPDSFRVDRFKESYHSIGNLYPSEDEDRFT